MHTPRRLLHHLLVGSLGLLGSISLGVSGAHAMSATVSQTLDNVSVATDYEFDVSLAGSSLIYANGTGGYQQNSLRILFPEEFNLYLLSNCYSACINLNTSSNTNVEGINNFSVDPSTNTIDVSFSYEDTQQPTADTTLSFTISSLISPATVDGYSIGMELIDGSDSSTITSTSATVSTTSALDASFEADDLTPGATGTTYTVHFSIPTGHMVNKYAGIHFPIGTNLSGASVSLNSSDPSHNPHIQNVSIDNTFENYLLVRFTSGATPTDAPSVFSIDISGVENSSTHPTSALGVATYESFSGYNSLIPAWGGGTATQAGGSGGINNETATSNNYAIATTDNTYTVKFDYTDTIATGYKIALTFPNNINIGGVTNPDVTLNGGTLAKGTATISGQTITIPVSAGSLTNDEVTIVINNINNPTVQAGIYAIGIQVYDASDAIVATGMAQITFGSVVQVSALVTEALILTLGNTAVSLTANPLNNDGIDKSTFTELTVYSNSPSGYRLSALLENGKLEHDQGLGEILSGTTEGTFGYHATNLPHDPLYVFDGDQAFTGTNNPLRDQANNQIGHNNVADPLRHTVYYDLDVNFLTPAGTYTGLIYYTVAAGF